MIFITFVHYYALLVVLRLGLDLVRWQLQWMVDQNSTHGWSPARRKCTTDLEFGNYTILTKLTPSDNCHGWSPTIPRTVTHQSKDGQPPEGSIVQTQSIIATLGSILDSQLSWESGKFQLARWSHRVVLLSDRIIWHLPLHILLSFSFWVVCCHTRLHLGFSAKLRIWQVPACKMEPRSGIIFDPYAISPCSSYYKDGHPPTRG